MNKLTITLGIASLAAAVGIACTAGTSGEPINIHGHVAEQMYEVIVTADQLEAFRAEEGYFYCDGNLCHIGSAPAGAEDHSDIH